VPVRVVRIAERGHVGAGAGTQQPAHEYALLHEITSGAAGFTDGINGAAGNGRASGGEETRA